MGRESTEVHQAVNLSIKKGRALTATDIQVQREKNEKAVKLYKLVFWIAIAIFNVFLWVPMPLAGVIKMTVAGISLACAFILPIYGIRKHQRHLRDLEPTSPGPKKSRASDAGRAYIESVRKEGRDFVKAEVETLEASRESAS